ncbi:MAG: c-type cytochrome domain-containing protein [Vicinamibacterales bacterium]
MQRAVLITVAAVPMVVYGASRAVQPVSAAQAPARHIDFVKDVQPIFREHCYECHGARKQMNGFRLDRRSDALRGGTIPVIAPGSSQSSRLYLRLIGDRYGRQMPVEGEISPGEIDVIKTWLDEGAEWPDAASGETPPPPVSPEAVQAGLRLLPQQCDDDANDRPGPRARTFDRRDDRTRRRAKDPVVP